MPSFKPKANKKISHCHKSIVTLDGKHNEKMMEFDNIENIKLLARLFVFWETRDLDLIFKNKMMDILTLKPGTALFNLNMIINDLTKAIHHLLI